METSKKKRCQSEDRAAMSPSSFLAYFLICENLHNLRMKRLSAKSVDKNLLRNLRMASSGFTLIEVLIAMAIIGIGLITLLTLFPIGLRSSRLAGDFTTASFIGQQALDNIRANAQVYDPGDTFFDNTYNPRAIPPGRSSQYATNHNGLGYYELPISAVKGYLSPLRFPTDPTRAQTWTIEITGTHDPSTSPPVYGTYKVISSLWGEQTNPGTINTLYTSDGDKPDQISFVLMDNRDGPDPLPLGWDTLFDENGTLPGTDKNYDEFTEGDEIVIHIEMVAGVPYYWYAMRAPVTEDQDLDGILDGILPGAGPAPLIRSGGHGQKYEDTGLDLVPDYWDTNNSGNYQKGLDKDGEFSDLPGRVAFPGDPHGDNYYAYNNSLTGWWDTTTVINPNGTEANGKIDQYPDDVIQKVTVTVGWREGGQDRSTTFSASLANQYR